MASQVSHIIYAKRYLEKYPSNLDRDEFILGTVFPDIRNIAEHVSRRDSHMRFPSVDLNFSKLDSFHAGWKFHLYCDMKRDEILNKYNFYELKNTADFSGNAAKLFEDELVYSEYDNWEKLVCFFNHPPYIESNLRIDEETFDLWYAIVAKYIEKKPDDRSMKIFLIKQPTRFRDADAAIQSISKLRGNKKAREILLKVREEIV